MNKRLAVFLLSAALAAAPASAQLQVNGYLSFQYQKGQPESDNPTGQFGNARGGLFFSGLIEKAFDYSLELRADSPDHVELQEAWAGYRPSDTFHIKLGLYLVPFGTYNTASRPYQTPFIRTPLLQAALYPEGWRDLGALAEGRLGFLQYSVYLGNGLREAADLFSGQQFGDNNGNKALGGRVSFNLSQGFEAGLSYHRGRFDDAGERSLTLQGAHISWATQGFRFLYEYGRADIDNPAGFAKGKVRGHIVLGSLDWGGFSPVVSYQKVDYDDPYHGAGFSITLGTAGAGIASAVSRWTAGLVFAPVQAVMLKVEYDFNREKLVEIKNNVLLAQVAVRF
ncbi:MAG: hypothetical protein A2W03_08235 [Candidatus Aminicenantes bacterium RBG_16_63_16]|nr:MAG: hypothetical protein A2W03_08235 [Candidatus Aminicenantes bacterium RBG_16_63_16]